MNEKKETILDHVSGIIVHRFRIGDKISMPAHDGTGVFSIVADCDGYLIMVSSQLVCVTDEMLELSKSDTTSFSKKINAIRKNGFNGINKKEEKNIDCKCATTTENHGV